MTGGFTTPYVKAAMTPRSMSRMLGSLISKSPPLSPIRTAPSTPGERPLHTMGAFTPTTCLLYEKKLGTSCDLRDNISNIEPVLPDDFFDAPCPPALVASELSIASPELSPVPFVASTSKSRLFRRGSTSSTSSHFSSEPTSPRTALRKMTKMRRPSPPKSPKKKRSKLGHQSAKTAFLELVEALQIVNIQQYEEHLVTSSELRKLEKAIQPSTLEQMKKIQFRQNFLMSRSSVALTSRLTLPRSEKLLRGLKGGWKTFVDAVAASNGLSRNSLLYNLGRWVLNLEQKKKGLILIGASDSGKTFFADCLLAAFHPSEIGYFQCPMSNNVSNFMYANLINKLVYRCDEFFLEQLGVLQSFKQLTEGSKTLQTEIKYKDAINVDPRPVVVTMNGAYRSDVVKYHSQEWTAIKNRCLILKMEAPLKSMFTNLQLDSLRKGAHVLLSLVLENTEDVSRDSKGIEEFEDYV